MSKDAPVTKDEVEAFEAKVISIVLKAIKGRGRVFREIMAELQIELSRFPDKLRF